jgi:GT2 family glycosyltransferase
VVVPTCNRREFLADVVEALQAQSLTSFRAVLVDDGSTDDTVEVARKAIGDDERFEVVSTQNRGPASARNVACGAATTEWLAFTDDDCVPQPTWLEGLLAAAGGSSADIVQGRTISDPTVRRRDMPWFVRGKDIEGWSGRFQTCNLLIRRSRLDEVGGFDESFPPRGFGEDTDVGLRIVRAGGSTTFAPDAVVHHRVLLMTYPEFLRRRYRWAQVVHLVAVNPDARSTFPHRYVAQRSHVALWLFVPVAVGALRRRRWSVPVVGVMGFVAQRAVSTRHEDRSTTTKVMRAPLELVGVGVEAVGFVVESIRHRSLLL